MCQEPSDLVKLQMVTHERWPYRMLAYLQRVARSDSPHAKEARWLLHNGPRKHREVEGLGYSEEIEA